jgi:prevent-host-death family protein
MPKKPAKTKRKKKARTARRSVPLAAPKRASAVWSIQDGKDGFSAMVEASQRAPQTVTKHGRPAAVLVGAEEYERLKSTSGGKQKTFVEHLLDIPQGGEDFERLPFVMRDIEF